MFLRDLVEKFGGEACGEVTLPLTGVGSLEAATSRQISFFADPRLRAKLASSAAAAIIVAPAERPQLQRPGILAQNPHAYYARVASYFHPLPAVRHGIHPMAVIHPTANVDAGAEIAAFVSIGANTQIGPGAVLGPGCVIGDDVLIGADTRLFGRVSVYQDCQIGARTIVHAGAVIGADGFGFAHDRGHWEKIPQIGRVLIGSDCEIGANTTIDRGALDDTVIGDGVKIDNQVQIAHNCRVGDHSIIAGCVGIAGSARIGKRVRIGGAAVILGHLQICDDAEISAMTMVSASITEPGKYTSGMLAMPHRQWARNTVHIRRLDMIAKAVKSKGDQS